MIGARGRSIENSPIRVLHEKLIWFTQYNTSIENLLAMKSTEMFAKRKYTNLFDLYGSTTLIMDYFVNVSSLL